MIRYALIEPETGVIVQTGSGPDAEHLTLQEQVTGLSAIEIPDETLTDASHYWTGEGFAVYPPRPGDWALWDGQQWVDPRTDDDHAADLEARRNAASITKSAFLQACIAVGLLSPAEAADAARGYIPTPFETAIAGLPAEQRDMIPVIWPAVTRVDRMDPMILAVAAGRGIDDALLDEIFGLDEPTADRFQDG